MRKQAKYNLQFEKQNQMVEASLKIKKVPLVRAMLSTFHLLT
jgi:hypothetical protein